MTDLLRRTTLIVADAERAARFHESVFGWTRYLDTPFTLSGTQLAAGAAGDETRLIILKAADPVIGMLGLLEWTSPRRPAPDAKPPCIEPGRPIFVVAATDCAATIERARATGARIHCEPRPWSTTGADGATLTMLGASFFDPDGYFFEVNQRLP
ncbi:MAG: VOC family protein [Sphingomonadaceae bacterium]|nr:VOC family protein [Sphingomonadaceae bacterium]